MRAGTTDDGSLQYRFLAYDAVECSERVYELGYHKTRRTFMNFVTALAFMKCTSVGTSMRQY